MKYTKKLMLLTLIISSAMMLPLSSFAQSIPQTTVSTARYDSMLRRIADGNQAIRDLATWKAEAEAWEKEAARKETVLKNQISKNIDCYRAKDTLTAKINLQDAIIENKESMIRKLGTKPKRFALGIQAGYGYQLGQTVTRGAYIGAGMQWNILRF